LLVYGEVGLWFHSETGYEQTNVPISVVAAYDFNISERFHAKVGVHAGVTILSGEFKDGLERYFAEGKNTFTQAAASGGVLVGASWDFAEKWTLDVGYKFTANSAVQVLEGAAKNSSTMHQITVGAAFRF